MFKSVATRSDVLLPDPDSRQRCCLATGETGSSVQVEGADLSQKLLNELFSPSYVYIKKISLQQQNCCSFTLQLTGSCGRRSWRGCLATAAFWGKWGILWEQTWQQRGCLPWATAIELDCINPPAATNCISALRLKYCSLSYLARTDLLRAPEQVHPLRFVFLTVRRTHCFSTKAC